MKSTKNFFLLMLIVLYKAYRRNNNSFIASFHSKGILSINIILYILNLNILLVKVFGLSSLELNLPSNKFVLGIFLLLPVELLVFFLTPKHGELDKYDLDDSSYYKGWSYFLFFFGIAILMFFYLSIRYKH